MADPNPNDDADELRDVVAIDGPSASGKSTVARLLAERLRCLYLDTGAMYRAVTWHLLESQVADFGSAEEVEPHLRALDIELDPFGRVLIDGKDVSSHLRSHEVEIKVSAVSALSTVRSRMRELQRGVARRGRVVAEGRDMGSVVFPAARWKFFLDADPQERARRRLLDFRAQGRAEVSESDVLDEIAVRDHLDSTRPDAPLMRANGAQLVDTTSLEADQVVERLAAIVELDEPTDVAERAT